MRTLRDEALDHILRLSERHVRSVLAEFVAYYNRDRPHRSLELETAVPACAFRPFRTPLALGRREVVSRPVPDLPAALVHSIATVTTL